MNKRVQKHITIKYEPEADVLWWEITKDPIDYAEEMGNVVVHFNKKNVPVLIEVLEAKKFLSTTRGLVNARNHRHGIREVAFA